MLEIEHSSSLLFMDARPGRGAEAEPPPVATLPPEAALVEAVRGGDREAFSGLYGMFAPMVHGILLARVPFDEVSDLVQEVFLLAFRKLDSLRDGARFGPWVAMIARNRATDFHRRARETEELKDDAPASARPTAEAAEVLEVIRALPEAYRETLVLRLVEGLTGPEIAERTGLQPASVRVNLHRGMKILRERLSGKGREQ